MLSCFTFLLAFLKVVTVVKGKLIHQRLKRKLCSPVIHIFHDYVIMLNIENDRKNKMAGHICFRSS